MPYALGVDAGNTKTIALICRLDGSIVGAGRGGCGDIYGAASAAAALAAVRDAVEAALRDAGIDRESLVAGAFSMAGADWPEDFAYLRASMVQAGFGSDVMIVNDALGALRVGSPDGPGVAVVCGTGAAIGGRAPDGRVWHTGFWGGVGGSHHLAETTLRAVYRAELGIDPPTSLTARVLDFFGLSREEEVLHRLTARAENPRPNIAGLTAVLLDEADGGDSRARRIVEEHGGLLGDYALATARRLGIEAAPFTLVLAGGVLRHPTRLLSEAIVTRVQSRVPTVSIVENRLEPAAGALLLALDLANVAVDEAITTQLARSMPPASLFSLPRMI